MTDYPHLTDEEIRDLELAIGDKGVPSEPVSNVVTLPKKDTTAPHAAGFDYSGLPASVAKEAEATASRIKERMRAHIIETGKELLKIKKKLGHGRFGKWLDFHFGWKERTAQNYMNSATEFGSAPQVIDVLPPSTVYKLAAKSTPAELRQLVIDTIKRGDTPDPKQIENQITEKKVEARQRREAAAVVQTAGPAVSAEMPERDADSSPSQNSTISKPESTINDAAGPLVSEANRNELRAKKLVLQLKAQLGAHFDQLRRDILEIDFQAFKKALQEG